MSGDESTRLAGRAGVIECSIVPWDTDVFGFPVGQVTHIDFEDDEDAGEVLGSFERWCVANDVRLVSCRLDHLRLRESMVLEELGFRFIETVYRPRFDRFGGVDTPKQAIEVTEATAADVVAIEEIASHAFTTGRFRLDRRLPPELSDRRYATWVRNSLESADQTVLKGVIGDEIVGFFIVEARPNRSVYWHLTAVAPA